jgi:hypothetical protein
VHDDESSSKFSVSSNTCDTANKTIAMKKDPFLTIPGTFLNNEAINAIPSSAK